MKGQFSNHKPDILLPGCFATTAMQKVPSKSLILSYNNFPTPSLFKDQIFSPETGLKTSLIGVVRLASSPDINYYNKSNFNLSSQIFIREEPEKSFQNIFREIYYNSTTNQDEKKELRKFLDSSKKKNF
jgi:hypothetical protein